MFPWLWLRRWALPYLPCLTESWKQRQENKLGFIFIPQPGISTEREDGCCLVSFTSYAQRRYNFWSSHFCLFLTPQFFSLSLAGEIQDWFFKQDFQLKLLMPRSKASLCLLNCKVLAKKAKYWVYTTGLVTLVISVSQGVAVVHQLLPQPERGVSHQLSPGRNVLGEARSWQRIPAGCSCCGGIRVCEQPQLCWARLFPGLVPHW